MVASWLGVRDGFMFTKEDFTEVRNKPAGPYDASCCLCCCKALCEVVLQPRTLVREDHFLVGLWG